MDIVMASLTRRPVGAIQAISNRAVLLISKCNRDAALSFIVILKLR
jgi:hypothetical protein